jgi:hypothetical protein
MDNKLITCPKCLGAQQLMEAKQTAGFEYRTCSLCKGEGEVLLEIEEDFILSINENLIDDYE